jgi:hypothetical protein
MLTTHRITRATRKRGHTTMMARASVVDMCQRLAIAWRAERAEPDGETKARVLGDDVKDEVRTVGRLSDHQSSTRTGIRACAAGNGELGARV